MTIADKRGARHLPVAFLATALLLPLAAPPARAADGEQLEGEKRITKKKEPPKPVRLTMAATVERLPLPSLHGPVELTVDALSRWIRLRPTKDTPTALAAKLSAHAGAVCPKVAVHDGLVELTCRSRRIEAQLTSEGKATFLDINELRGLPWRPGLDAAPSYFFDPWRVGLGQGCPARGGVARGECELKEGHVLAAASLFRNGLSGPHRQMASLRLGDLALRTGDPLTAVGWYRRVGDYGPFGHMASQRLCELTGDCLDDSEELERTYDARGLPEPLRAESVLRAARTQAYLGHVTEAVRILSDQIDAHGAESVCREEAEFLCRRILLQGMREAARAPVLHAHPAVAAGPGKGAGGAPGSDAAVKVASSPAATKAAALAKADAAAEQQREFEENLMQSYLELPSWDKGPLAVELAEAGATVAIRMGAPDFAGNLLASSAREVPDAHLSDHLLAAVEAFLRAEDLVRARVVAEYMGTRLGPKARVSERWKATLKTLAARSEEDEMTASLRDQIEKETLSTLAGLKDADAAAKKATTLMSGLKAATPKKGAQNDEKQGDGDAKDAKTTGQDATGGKEAAAEPPRDRSEGGG
ncbi:MAG TPA: hypothetical protein VH328_10385 [Burkholderiaceae bacterium]|nr:hypothetical protein [Burkholderiaceae bacterium]